jgi:hypothetical protein
MCGSFFCKGLMPKLDVSQTKSASGEVPKADFGMQIPEAEWIISLLF